MRDERHAFARAGVDSVMCLGVTSRRAVLAVWYQAVPDVLARYGDQLDGKVVVDITNPVDPETYAPLTVEAGSVAQEIANTVPGAKV